MTFTNKGVKTEYPYILNIFMAIDLSCNNFKGLIPESLYYLYGLQSINLSNNHLEGCILPSLGNLRKLESLDLSQNELVREIPHELSQLGFLEVFNVSFNHLHGDIPQGKQLITFENNSYMGNPELCGAPLSKKCEISTTPSNPRTNNEYKCFLIPSDKTDWVIMFLGVGSGFVVGIVLGNLLYAKCSDWVVESSEMRKHRWVKPIRNTRRN
ncbi:receptor-like protein 34 [Bidens hawaiensis]|uniref:receptor-like protein 34 n=1 Tax=Bidens hawaiensis TaxID=980011 RepID=UPI0040493BBC